MFKVRQTVIITNPGTLPNVTPNAYITYRLEHVNNPEVLLTT
uniref:Uncharacterized protein n=1 Tax=viral metagenome TaxID=1070528 RepID=A0A6C0BPI8_9ZZZZ